MGSALAATAVLAACGESEEPGSGQSGDSTTTPSPTTEPDSTATATDQVFEYPAEGDVAVVRVEQTGGFGMAEDNIRRLPLVSLYGDGNLIIPGPMIEIFPPPALPNLQVTTLNDEGIQEILKKVDAAGLLDGDRDFTDDIGITDAQTTTFTVTAGGQTSVTRVYALGFEDLPGDMPEDVREAREKLSTFLGEISGASTWLPESAIVEAEHGFEIERLQIVVYPYDTSVDYEVDPGEMGWPLKTQPTDVGEPFDFMQHEARCAVLEGYPLETMLGALEHANSLTRWVTGKGTSFIINRPLLPGEEGCHNEASDPGAGSGSSEIEHPTAADEVIIRYELTGGFVPIEFYATSMPQIALYGDGMTVTPGFQTAIYPGQALPPLEFSFLSEQGIQTVLVEAQNAGLLEGDQDWHDLANSVTDLHTGILTIQASGETSVILVYGPGMEDVTDVLSEEEIAFREKFDDFTAKLQSLTTWLPEGSFVDHDDEYPLDRLQIISQPAELATVGDPNIDANHVDWPLATPLSELGEPAFMEESRCFVLEGEGFQQVFPLLQDATTITRWNTAGESYVFYPRPLLPDEEGCVDPFA